MNEDWNDAGFRTQLLATVNGVADFKNVYTSDALGRVTQITQQGWGGRTVVDKRVKYTYNAASEVTKVERHRSLTTSAPVMETNFGRGTGTGTGTLSRHLGSIGDRRRRKIGTGPEQVQLARVF